MQIYGSSHARRTLSPQVFWVLSTLNRRRTAFLNSMRSSILWSFRLGWYSQVLLRSPDPTWEDSLSPGPQHTSWSIMLENNGAQNSLYLFSNIPPDIFERNFLVSFWKTSFKRGSAGKYFNITLFFISSSGIQGGHNKSYKPFRAYFVSRSSLLRLA